MKRSRFFSDAVFAAHPAVLVLPPASRHVSEQEAFAMQQNNQAFPPRFTAERLTYLSLLIALQVVLGNVTQIPFIAKQFNFGFLPVAIAGALLGPISAAVVGALGDFIGAHLFPQGVYFLGFTLTGALIGFWYGWMLHGKRPHLLRAVATAAIGAVINLLLNSLWLSVLYGSKTYWGWLTARALSYPLEMLTQAVLIYGSLVALCQLKLPQSMKLPPKENKHEI